MRNTGMSSREYDQGDYETLEVKEKLNINNYIYYMIMLIYLLIMFYTIL